MAEAVENDAGDTNIDSFEEVVLADGLCTYLRKRRTFSSWQKASHCRRVKLKALQTIADIYFRVAASRVIKVLHIHASRGKYKQMLASLVTDYQHRHPPILAALQRWRSWSARTVRLHNAARAVEDSSRQRLLHRSWHVLIERHRSAVRLRGHEYVASVHHENRLRARAWAGLIRGTRQAVEEEAQSTLLRVALRRWRSCLERNRPAPSPLVRAVAQCRARLLAKSWAAWVAHLHQAKASREAHRKADEFRRRVLLYRTFSLWLGVSLESRYERRAQMLAVGWRTSRATGRAWDGWVAYTRRKRLSTAARMVACNTLMKKAMSAWAAITAIKRTRRAVYMAAVHAVTLRRARAAVTAWRAWTTITAADRTSLAMADHKWSRRAARMAVHHWLSFVQSSKAGRSSLITGERHYRRKALAQAVAHWTRYSGGRGRLKVASDALSARVRSKTLRTAYTSWRSAFAAARAARADEDAALARALVPLHRARLVRIWTAWRQWHSGHMRRAVQSALARHRARVSLLRLAWRAWGQYGQDRRRKRALAAQADRVDAVRVAWRAWSIWRGAVEEARAQARRCEDALTWHRARLARTVFKAWAGYVARRRALARELLGILHLPAVGVGRPWLQSLLRDETTAVTDGGLQALLEQGKVMPGPAHRPGGDEPAVDPHTSQDWPVLSAAQPGPDPYELAWAKVEEAMRAGHTVPVATSALDQQRGQDQVHRQTAVEPDLPSHHQSDWARATSLAAPAGSSPPRDLGRDGAASGRDRDRETSGRERHDSVSTAMTHASGGTMGRSRRAPRGLQWSQEERTQPVLGQAAAVVPGRLHTGSPAPSSSSVGMRQGNGPRGQPTPYAWPGSGSGPEVNGGSGRGWPPLHPGHAGPGRPTPSTNPTSPAALPPSLAQPPHRTSEGTAPVGHDRGDAASVEVRDRLDEVQARLSTAQANVAQLQGRLEVLQALARDSSTHIAGEAQVDGADDGPGRPDYPPSLDPASVAVTVALRLAQWRAELQRAREAQAVVVREMSGLQAGTGIR